MKGSMIRPSMNSHEAQNTSVVILTTELFAISFIMACIMDAKLSTAGCTDYTTFTFFLILNRYTTTPAMMPITASIAMIAAALIL